MSGLKKQIENAQRSIRELKEVAPYMFPQYSHLIHAEQALKRAQEDYDEAKKAWDELGNA